MSNEKEIRNKIKDIISNQDEDIVIIDEFCGGTMQTRADLAFIKTDMLIMVEIKSDKDTLVRLENQLRDYAKYSTAVFIVLDIVHKDSFHRLLNKTSTFNRIPYQLFFYEDNLIKTGNREIKEFDKYHLSSWKKPIDMFHLLWREEKKQLINFIKGRSKADLEESIKSIYTYNELCEISNAIIHDRVKRNIGKVKDFSINNGIAFGRIKNIKFKEMKQILFNDYLNNKI